MKYSLRSLMVVVLVGPPLLAGAWFAQKRFWREVPPRTTPSLRRIVIPYHSLHFDTAPTDEEWAEAAKEGSLVKVPVSQVPDTNPPKD